MADENVTVNWFMDPCVIVRGTATAVVSKTCTNGYAPKLCVTTTWKIW